MSQPRIPFQSIDWSTIERTEHKGEQGSSWWQTLQFGGLRLRLVEYSPGYLADHWCRKGHIVHCLEGAFVSELADGRRIELRAGDSYIVSDDQSSHRSVSETGVKLLIIDGDFLQWQAPAGLPVQLETERLLLKRIDIDDAGFLMQLVNSEGWIRNIGDRNVHTTEAAIAYVQRMQAAPNGIVHVIRRREDGVPMGITTFLQRDWLEHPDIGFALLGEFMGKGYATEAMGALLDLLQKAGQAKAVQAITLPDNEASKKVLEKLGLRSHRDVMEGEERLLLYEKAFS